MSLGPSLVLYLLAGAGVAFAVALSGAGASAAGRVFRAAAAVFFWPLFVPLLLSGPGEPAVPPDRPNDPAPDELSAAIARADAELEAALDSLDGWADRALLRERGRVRELRAAWHTQAERVREMDRLLARPEPEPTPAADDGGPAAERLRQLERARRINRERLRQLRGQAQDDLMTSLAWVRELASTITLARFTGEPAARAEELVARLAAAVEDVSAGGAAARDRRGG